MKNIYDNLTLAGRSISQSDLVTQILAGLDTKYTPIFVYLTEKEDISWVVLQLKLLTYEAHLEQIHSNTQQNITSAFCQSLYSLHSSTRFQQQQLAWKERSWLKR